MSELETNIFVPFATAVTSIGHARSATEVIARLRSTARSLIGCDGIAIIRRDGDLCHYVEEDAIGALWKGQKFPMSACISGWAMLHRQTAIVPDIDLDARIPHELYEETFVRAVAMAPISRTEPVGALGAYWATRRSPTDLEIIVLEALANAAAGALAGADLVDVTADSDLDATGAMLAVVRSHNGIFEATLPDAPGVVGSGSSFSAALASATSALAAWVSALDDRGLGIPEPRTLDEILGLPELANEQPSRRNVAAIRFQR